MYQTTNPSPAIEKPVVEAIRKNRTSVRNTEKMSRWASSVDVCLFHSAYIRDRILLYI